MKKLILYAATSLLLLAIFPLLMLSSCHREICNKKHEHKLFVANEDGGSVSVIDASSYELIEEVDLTYKDIMYMPHNVQVAPDRKSVWITANAMHGHGDGDDFVMVIQGRRHKIKEYIDIGHHEHLAHVVLDTDSKFAYVSATDKDEIIKIDVDKMKIDQRFTLASGSQPHGMRYMNGKLYIACMGTKEMVIMDVANGNVTNIPVGGIAVQTAVLPDLNCVYVSVYDLKQVVRYDINTGDTTQIILPGGSQGPIQLYPSPDMQKLYICDQGIVNGNPSSNKVYVLNTTANAITNTVTVGNGAHGIVVNDDGAKIFVTNMLDNTVSVVDAGSLTILKTINVGETPNGISIMDCE